MRIKGQETPRGNVRVVFKNFEEEAGYLRKIAATYANDRRIRDFTLKVIREAHAPAKDKPSQAMAIAEWVQKNVYYVHEGVETFQNPLRTLGNPTAGGSYKDGAGDCDDMTTLICAMLSSIGIQNRMCLLKINGRWAHIFPIAVMPVDGAMHRMTLDATLDEPVASLINPIAKVKARGAKVETKIV